jgi:polyphosphate kinase
VFYFHNAGADDVYLSSADWMDRNFFRRIESCFPVLDARLKRRVIREGLKPFLETNSDVWEMSADGLYKHRKLIRGKTPHVQTLLLSALTGKAPE